MGPNYFVFRGRKNEPNASTGKWFHSYNPRSKKTWKYPTWGCIRTDIGDLNESCVLYSWNKCIGHPTQVTVGHLPFSFPVP